MQERLQKLIASRGVASRRAAETLIRDGKVTVNGITALIGQSADPDVDEIRIENRLLPSESDTIVIALNKPVGFVTTMKDEKGRKCVSDLVSSCPDRVYPIGRLDMFSEGLLLLTNNGELANKLGHPGNGKTKEYEVSVKNYSVNSILRLEQPMIIDGYLIKPVQVRLISQSENKAVLQFSLTEGRNRQIRKMCEKCDLTILALKRTEFCGISLGSLKPGKWRYLTADEIGQLF